MFLLAGDDVRDRIIKWKEILTSIIEPDSGLLDLMHSRKILNYEELVKILSFNTVYEKNKALLKWLVERYTGHCSEIMDVLKESGQKHIVHYLTADGGVFILVSSAL
jgi:Caspase recruitment domain